MPFNDRTTSEVAALTSIAYSTIDSWLRQGIITCAVASHGIGSRRRFTLLDIAQTLIADRIRHAGMLTMADAAGFNAILRTHWHDDDPDHAGYILATRPADPAEGDWFATPPELQQALAELVTSPQSTGFTIVFDATYAARAATAVLEAGLAGRRHDG